MALKADRIETQTDVSFFMDETATRGVICTISSGGSGVSMDDANAKVTARNATASGSKPVGVLLNDVVNLDLTRQHINFHQDEVQKGSKVTLLQIGQITTNNISGTPAAGDPAYLGVSGVFSNAAVSDSNQENDYYRVGRFLSGKDQNSFAKVAVNIA